MYSEYLLVKSRYSNIKGLYKLVLGYSYAAYKNEENELAIYKLDYRTWVLGMSIESRSIYTKIYNNSKDPNDIEEWKNGTSFIRISEFIKPVISDLTIKQNVLIKSQYSNIDGLYNFINVDKFGYPFYKNGNDSLYLSYSIFEKKWLISPKLNHQKIYYSINSQDIDPCNISIELYGSGIDEITEFIKPIIENYPKYIGIKSIYSNLDGGYKLDEIEEGYPIYKNNEDQVDLWYNGSKFNWYIGNKSNGSYFTSFKTHEINLCKLEKENYPDEIINIYEIDWGENMNDDNYFIDNSFPRSSHSLGKIFNNEIEWIRADQLNRLNTEYLYDTISASDLCQGRIGNCWLIAAISSIAQYPELILKILGNLNMLTPDHRYELQLWNTKSRCFHNIIIDDYIPCYKREMHDILAKPIFCSSDSNKQLEIWPLLIEKAIAKYVGTYEDLDGGFVSWAWLLMTGNEKQILYKKKNNGWIKYESEINKRSKTKMDDLIFYTEHRKPILNNEILINELDKYINKKSLLATSIDGELEGKLNNGLITGHAYSILGKYTVEYENKQIELIKLRNPWGDENEWNGKWSDNWDGWKDKQQLLMGIEHKLEKDGIFIMELDDFNLNFTTINICEI
jgi:calpain-15